MAHVTRHDPGIPSWVDLGTPDLEASIAFYGGLFGWQIEKGPEEAGGYSMCLLRGEPVAAIGPLMQEGQPPSWSTYVTVDQAEATVARAKDAGATVFVEPMRVEIGGDHMGTMAVMADPAGAAISIWEPGSHIGASIINEPGAMTWNELVTRDIDQAKAFYQAVFGWGAVTAEAPPTTYTEWKLGDLSIAGMLQMNDEWPAEIPSHWSAYFAVADTDQAAAKAQELGATVAVDPQDIPGVGRFSLLKDPQGAMFTVLHMTVTA